MALFGIVAVLFLLAVIYAIVRTFQAQITFVLGCSWRDHSELLRIWRF